MMNDESILLLNMINEGRSLYAISKALKLSNEQLSMRLSMLRNSGYIFGKLYYYDGNIRYSLKNLKSKKIDDTKKIIVPKNTTTLKAVLISDTHLGHIYDEPEILNSVYEFCAKERINIILNAGDFFEGIYEERRNQCKYTDPYEQITYGLKFYPYDKNILNFVILGNHDATFYLDAGIDIKKTIEECRYDIIPIGYGNGEFEFDEFLFRMQHPICRDGISISTDSDTANKVIIKGHSHKFKVVCGEHTLSISLPSTSSVSVAGDNNPIPSMIKMELKTNDKKTYIMSELFEQYIFIKNQPVRVNEIEYNILISNVKKRKKYSKEYDISEESISYPSTYQNSVYKYQGMSQIDKFNEKYNVDKQVQKVKK